MWKKKRYDIRIRLSPEEIEALRGIFSFIDNFRYGLDDIEIKKFTIFEELYWKIHNKCVEINRK